MKLTEFGLICHRRWLIPRTEHWVVPRNKDVRDPEYPSRNLSKRSQGSQEFSIKLTRWQEIAQPKFGNEKRRKEKKDIINIERINGVRIFGTSDSLLLGVNHGVCIDQTQRHPFLSTVTLTPTRKTHQPFLPLFSFFYFLNRPPAIVPLFYILNISEIYKYFNIFIY